MSNIRHNMALVIKEHNKKLRKSHEEYSKHLDTLNDEISMFKELFGASLHDVCKASGVYEEMDKLEILNKELIAKFIAQEKQSLEIVGIDYFFARLHREFPELQITRDDFLMLAMAFAQLDIIKVLFNGLRRSLNKQLEGKRNALQQ